MAARLDAALRTVRRFLGFALVPALATVTPLLVTPLVVQSAGAAGFLAIAVGQSVGTFGGIVVALEWPLTGPVLIAQAGAPARRVLYRESVETRLVAFLATAPVCAVTAWLLVPDHRPAAALMAVAVTGNGFTSAWYYTGIGAARNLVVLEAGLRVGAAALAAVALAAGLPLVTYPALLVAAAAAALLLNTRHICGSARIRVPRSAVGAVRRQLPVTASRVARGAYSFCLTPLATLLVPQQAFVVAGLDRLQRSCLTAVLAAPQSLIAWVARDGGDLRARQRVALLVDVLVVAAASAAFWLALPALVHLLFGGELAVTPELRAVLAAGLATKLLSECLVMHGLVPAGLTRFASSMLAVTSVLGCVLLAAVCLTAGSAVLVLAATVVVELAVCASCLARLRAAPAALEPVGLR